MRAKFPVLGRQGTTWAAATFTPVQSSDEVIMFKLPDLPYSENALEPIMSAETLREHHGKHHKKYVDQLNELIVGSDYEGESLEAIIQQSAKSTDADDRKVFNNAAQHWNHSFFWQSIGPDGGGEPQGELAELIDRDLGGMAGFREAFASQGSEHFGSGWVWLVLNGEHAEVITTHDADTPLAHGKTALLCCDLWEHAYYLDYQSHRADYLAAFADSLAQWRFAEENLASAVRTPQALTFAAEKQPSW